MMATPLDTSQQPIIVSASARLEMLVTGMRQIALIVGGAFSLAGFIRTHDIAGLIAWLRGNDFALFATALGTGGVFLYGQYLTWRKKREAVTIAQHVPDSVAVVKGSP